METKRGTIRCVNYWEIIAGNLSKSGWTWGCVSAVDSRGRTIFVADAHCGNGQRFIVRADEELTAFLKVGSARGGRAHRELAISWPHQCLRSHPGKLP